MRTLIRSLIWESLEEKPSSSGNYKSLRPNRLLSMTKEEEDLLGFCYEFYVSKGEAPSLKIVYDHFESEKKSEHVVYLEECLSEKLTVGASFEEEVEREVERQAKENLIKVLKKAGRIAGPGEEIKGGVIKGVDEAVQFLITEVKPVPKRDQEKDIQLSDSVLGLYDYRKKNKGETYGALTGFGLIDASTQGLKAKELSLFAGFGGHLKSTWMMNIILNSAVEGGWNNLLFTSEMPADLVKLMMVAIHSGHMKFGDKHPPLSATKIRLGALNDKEEEFFKLVANDLISNQDYGSIRVVDSGDFTTFGSVMQRSVEENIKEEVDVLWIDYITRLPVDLKYTRMDMTTARNEVIADAKRFAMSFDQGKGVAVCSPFQINREGYKRAKLKEGRMDKTSLAQYNAAEREADLIAYIYYDEEEQMTFEPKVGVLKTRYGQLVYDPLALYIDVDSRRIYDTTTGMSPGVVQATTAESAEHEVTI